MGKRKQNKATQKPGHIQNKHKKGKGSSEPKVIAYIAALILILLLINGCTEMTRTQKNLCYSLTTKSYAYVPVCETENSCYEKLNPLFKTNLGAELESQLYGVKNHVARSWFFYNQSIKEIKKLSDACKTGSSSSLAGGINQIQFYMDESFLELDEGMKESFNLITAEELLLSGQKIDLIKEESLYDSQIELRQIVAELNGGPTNSGSYVSYYSAKANEFANSAASKGFTNLVEKKPFWLEAFNYAGGTILTQMGAGKESSFAFIWPIFDNSISELESVFYTKQGLSALQRFPINEFMKLYSGLGGNDFSALKRFADLENRLSINQKAISAQQKILWEKAITEQQKIEGQISKLNIVSKFDVLSKEIMGTEISSTFELEETYQKAVKELIVLREKKARNELAIGEELFKLKKILAQFQEVSKYLGYGQEEYLQKLGLACDKTAGEFKDENFSFENSAFILLIEDAKYYASKTLSSSNETKLDYCVKFWENKKQIDLAKNDIALLESEKKDSAKECFAYLDKVFENAELYELKEKYLELKKTQITKEGLLSFAKACEDIKVQAENELNEEENSQNATKDYAALQSILKELKLVSSNMNSEEFDTKINALLKRVEQYSKYFNANGTILFDEFLPIQNELINSIENTLSDSKKLLKEGSLALIKKNAEIIYLNQSAPIIGEDANILAKLILNNSYPKIDETFFIDLNFSGVKIITDTNCLGSVFEIEKGRTRFLFNCLSQGITEIEFSAIERLSSFEKNEFVSVSNEESILKRTISISNSAVIPTALIKTIPPKGSYKIVALNNKNEILAVESSPGTIELVARPLEVDALIEAYFYLQGVILVEMVSDSTNISVEESRLHYLITAENTFDNELTASLFINLPVNSYTKDLEVFSGAQKLSPQVYLNKIVLSNQKFLPKQKKSYSLEVTLSNTIEYYLDELKRQRNEFLIFGVLDKTSKIEEVLSLGQENNPVSLKKLFEENESALSLLKTLDEKKKSAEVIRQELLQKIQEAKESVEQLKSIGLEAEAQKLDAVIAKALEENNLDTFEGVSKAYKEIISISFAANKEINSQAKTILDGAKKLYSAYPQEFSELYGELSIFEKDYELNSSTNPGGAQNSFILMEETYSKMVSLKEDLDKNAQKNAKLLAEEVKTLGETLNTLLDFLQKELFSPETNIADIKFVPPITESRLKTLRLNVSEILNSDKSDAEKKDKLVRIKNELSNASEYLRKEAVREFNLAIDSGTSNTVLSSAKSAIDENKFVTALFLLSKSGGLIMGFDYIGLLPIGIIIAVAFVLRHKFAKKEKNEEGARKLILDEWKE